MPGRKVFFSYSHDDKITIKRISDTVKEYHDLILIDRDIIKPGDNWRKVIGKALKKSYCIFYFASNTAKESEEVDREISYALELKKRIVPVLLEKCKLPWEISNIHYIDLTKQNDAEIEIFKQTLSGISSKKIEKPLENEVAKGIVKYIATSNSIYNKVIVPYKYVWFSTVAIIVLLFVLNGFPFLSKSIDPPVAIVDTINSPENLPTINEPEVVSAQSPETLEEIVQDFKEDTVRLKEILNLWATYDTAEQLLYARFIDKRIVALSHYTKSSSDPILLKQLDYYSEMKQKVDTLMIQKPKQ